MQQSSSNRNFIAIQVYIRKQTNKQISVKQPSQTPKGVRKRGINVYPMILEGKKS